MEKYSRGDAVLASVSGWWNSWRRFRSERRGLVKRLTRLSPEPPHPPFGHLLPAGEKGAAAISGEVTSDGKEDLAPKPLLPRGEKVPEGRMRGLRAPTAPAIFLPAGETGAAAISGEVTSDGKEDLAAAPLLPRGEKVPEGRMRGLRAPTAPVISHHENSPARGPASVTRQVVRARKSCVARNV